ncbi:MAG: response regulator transcription factor [Bryobacteraceae bacterium]
MERIKIVIADDHALVLEALLLLSEGAFQVVGKARDGAELLELSVGIKPDVYLVDINMPGLGGFEAARRLLERDSSARILFISGDCSARFVRESLRSGGYGFISKHASYAEFASAIESVARGQKFLDSSAKEALERNGDSAVLALTPRQTAVLQLIAEGLTAKEIASKLGLSPRTAEFHRQCIMERLDLHSTAELTRFAIEQGLITGPLDAPRTMAARHGA